MPYNLSLSLSTAPDSKIPRLRTSSRSCRPTARRYRNYWVLLSKEVPTPNAAVRLINRVKLLIDDTPTLSNAKKALWGWAAGDYDEDDIREKIDRIIRQNQVVVFGASFSLFSMEAKNLLDGLGAQVTYVDLDKFKGKEGVHFFHVLSKMTGRATVPHIFIKGKSYGGCMDGPGLVPLYEEGRLQELLKKAGAL